MANDFSTGDIYKEALRKLGEKREQPINAPKMPFAGLNERGNTAYDALDNEAYVNKALTDRAFGTAGDRMATLKQRRESNLRNTLGKNERQRRNFEQNVDLAIKNYETQQKADETIAAAQYGAAEAAAHVSQSNFEKQLGLKRQRLEMDKKNSEFEHAFKLLSDRKLNEKGFQDITGIKVKKKPRPKPVKLVIECGTEPPEARAGFDIRSTTDEYGVVQYYQVSTKLIEDAKAKGVSLFMPRSNLELTAAVETGNYIYANGKLKSDTQILLEVYGLDPDQGNYDEAYANLEANKEYIIKRYGENFFWSVSTSARYSNMAMKYATFEGTQYYNNMAIVSDLITNSETYIEQYGYAKYKGMLDLALDTAEQLYTELEPYAVNPQDLQPGNVVAWSSVKEEFPQYFGGADYSETSILDMQYEKMDLPPEAIDLNAVAAQLNLPEWYKVPEVWDWDSLIDAMALSEYMDWQFENRSDLDAELPDDNSVQYGASIYYAQSPSILRQKEEFNQTTQELIENEWDIFSETVNDYLKSAGVQDYDQLSVDQKFELGRKVIEQREDYYLNYNFDDQQQVIDALTDQKTQKQAELAEVKVTLSKTSYNDTQTYRELLIQQVELEAEIKELEAQTAAEQKEKDNAEQIQTQLQGLAKMEEPDFVVYEAKGAEIQNDTSGWLATQWNIQNKVAYGRDTYEEYKNVAYQGAPPPYHQYLIYHYMTNDEVKVYNYLLAKDIENGTVDADIYLNSLNEVLNYREGTAIAEELADKPVIQYIYSIPAGVSPILCKLERA